MLGIVRSFRDLAANMADASAAVMAGIAEALIATAVGLLVAIPAVVAYNVYKGRVKDAVTNCQLLARLLLAQLKAVDAPRATAEAAEYSKVQPMATSSLDNAAADDEGVLASINIIPFVDIVLVLLVIFMLTSATIVRASLKVELPKAASGGSKVASTLNLVATKDGGLSVNGEVVTSLEAAARIVKREAAADPKVQAVIAADKSAPYGRVVELIDLVKQNGVTAFALDIERGTPP